MNSREKWKPVVGYEGLYEVSNLGRIKSLPRTTTSGKILKQYVNKKNGYCYVALSKNNHSYTKRVHVLVLTAFKPSPKKDGYDKNWTIDHKDGNKANNNLDNLEWCTQCENQRRAVRMGLQKFKTKKVIDLTTLKIFDSATDAVNSVGGSRVSAITRVCQGLRSNYRNHRFAYYEDYLKNTIPNFKGKAKESCEKLWR
jgi:hypothetical protein